MPTKNEIKKIIILIMIFIIGIALFFFNAHKIMDKEGTIDSEISESVLPLVYVENDGIQINKMKGFLRDMGNTEARNSVTILPETRKLKLKIQEKQKVITKIQYEIRSLDLEQLIERTELTEWARANAEVQVVLPIQNLIARNQDYILKLMINTAEEEIYYYTRIKWVDQDKNYIEEMLELAESFSKKSLNYNDAKDLVAYLETNDQEDNSSLGHVTIKASYNHLTWDGLDVSVDGEQEITIQEYDGIMSQIQVNYIVKIKDENEEEAKIRVEDNYTMKWNEERIYMMNYERNAEEIFTSDKNAYKGKRILLGINRDEEIKTKKSENANYIAFKVNKNLWRYDQINKKTTNIFSYQDTTNINVTGYNKDYDIKILRVQNNGSIDFIVYGYIGSGIHEGSTGIIFYSYDNNKDEVQESFFLSVPENSDEIKEDIVKLSYMNENGMVYLMLQNKVYGIDITSNELVTVTDELREGSYVVSNDASRMAWNDGGKKEETEKIHIIDFDKSENREIIASSGEYIRVLGFVGNDLIYGYSKAEDRWIVNGKNRSYPMYTMRIADSEMSIQSTYEKEGIYIDNVKVDQGRIHLDRLIKENENEYSYTTEDTVVCNENVDNNDLEGIGWYASSQKGKVYFIQADNEIKEIKAFKEEKRVYTYQNESIIEIGGEIQNELNKKYEFYAYGGGHFLGRYSDFKSAVDEAYEKMGYVTDENQNIIWNRVNRSLITTIRSPEESYAEIKTYIDLIEDNIIYTEKYILIEATGCSINQILYFVDKGIPVIAKISKDKRVLITGYDQYNVTIYDQEMGETRKMGLGDAGIYFENYYNDYICCLKVG